MPEVSGLHVYPIKSLGGIALDRSVVERKGLRNDRRWMLVDDEGVFLSQRTFAEMALLKVFHEDGALGVRDREGAPIKIPSVPEGNEVIVTVWKSEVAARHVSATVDEWFSDRLGRAARLVWMPDDFIRPTHPDYTQPGDHVGFADAFPVLVAGEASLVDLNSRLDAPIPMNRFRPNVVLKGTDPYEEDGWTTFTLGGVRYRRAKKCGRCRVTTTDQDTAEVGVEPLRTLATYRREDNVVFFGCYFVPETDGEIEVGDRLEPLT